MLLGTEQPNNHRQSAKAIGREVNEVVRMSIAPQITSLSANLFEIDPTRSVSLSILWLFVSLLDIAARRTTNS